VEEIYLTKNFGWRSKKPAKSGENGNENEHLVLKDGESLTVSAETVVTSEGILTFRPCYVLMVSAMSKRAALEQSIGIQNYSLEITQIHV